MMFQLTLRLNGPQLASPSFGDALRLLITIILLGLSVDAFSEAPRPEMPACDLLLYNANVITQDGEGSKATSIGIGGGRILFADDRSRRSRKCERKIDLDGRVVIPGLIDSHIHFLRDGAFPGYDIRGIEIASSVADIQSLVVAASATAPGGSFIVAKGGFNHRQLAENRMPTMQELNAATTNFPVYLQEGFSGLAVANSLAVEYFRARGVPVSDNGVIVASNFGAAEKAMRETQTKQDRLRETKRLMRQAAEWGLTTIVDQGDAPAGYDPETHYDSIVALWRSKEMPIRVRLSLLSYDTDASGLLEERLRNNFMGFGDGRLAVAGVGEHIIQYRGLFSKAPPDELMLGKLMSIARKGWTYTQHSSSLEQNRAHIRLMAEVDQQIPIKDLHWSLAHVFRIGTQELSQLSDLGAGVTLQNHAYLAGRGPAAGPPYKAIVDSGIRAGGSTDARNVAPMNPWLSIYYMVTGKNSAGELINAGQTISREEALRMYTRDNAWVIAEEDTLGSIEEHKFADIVVLSDDYFSVSDEEIKSLRSVLTIVDGDIVHDEIHSKRKKK